MEKLKVDICVIGGGSGGLTVAAGASQMGASTVLVERGRMGGDCLNYGCVPSKALLAAAHAAEAMRGAPRFGIEAGPVRIDFERVHAHVHGVIGTIAPHDSVERFEGLGVKIIQAAAKFTDRRTVEAGDHVIEARRFVIATGSSAAVPPIPGLDTAPYFTNETIFDRKAAPEHLIVIGGGPIGAEMAQAHRRLGAKVTMLEMFEFLARDDPELSEIVKLQLMREAVDIREGVAVKKVERTGNGVSVVVEKDGAEDRIDGSDLLVAAGRRPNIDGLGLEAAGVEHSTKGIAVDARLRTTNRRIFAIGDVAGSYQFTHVAGYHAGIVIRNALFRLPAKVDYRAVWNFVHAEKLSFKKNRRRQRTGSPRRRAPAGAMDEASGPGRS